jgi:hypothetical protein
MGAEMTNCSNGFMHIGAELLDSPDVPFRTFWNWFRQTWISLHEEEYDHTNPEHIKACQDVANRRALPTPMEATNFQFRVTGLSRVALAQITRGRVGWAYNVESQMPQHIRHAVTIPRNIYEHPEFGERARNLTGQLQELYDNMYDAGIPPQDCRYLTMHGQHTSLVFNVNYAALLGYFARRCENGLTDELNLVGRLIRHTLMETHLDSAGNDRIVGSGWSFLLGKLEAMGADSACLNNDRVFGNTGRSPSAGDWVPNLLDGTCDYDFSKSAWYYELQELPDHLLFPGEKQMIDDFKAVGFIGRLQKLDSSGTNG